MRRIVAVIIGAGMLAGTVQARDSGVAGYPETRAVPIVETIFGEQVADPYRWLEQDVRTSPEVAQWVEEQNAYTAGVLARIPETSWFKRKIRELLNYERFGTPTRAGDRYFYSRNSGLQNQSQLFVQDGLEGTRRLLLDPNEWSADGTSALGDVRPSNSGKYLAYAVQENGSDWRTLRFVDVETGESLPDRLEWVKFPAEYANFAWRGDEGIFYLRFPPPADGQEFQALSENQKLYFHRLGTPQTDDVLIHETPDQPGLRHNVFVSHNGRWAVISSQQGTEKRHEIRLVELADQKRGRQRKLTLVTGFEHEWQFIDAVGSTLFFRTNDGAPKYRIVAMDMDAAAPFWEVMVAESEHFIERASIVGRRLVVSYLQDAATRAQVMTLTGQKLTEIALSQIGAAAGFTGSPDDPETFFSFSSFNRPSSVHRLNLDTGATAVFAEPALNFAPADYVVSKKFYTSKDGTRVPMFIVHRRDLTMPAPTLLYGYGGFDISLTPGFSSVRMAWLEAGGIFAMANVRGGGELGKDWYDSGRRASKQNSFDDFIAAGEALIAAGYTPRDGLAIQGGSNGGLLVGAVVNQRPDLFAAANPQVGVMDMLRFDRWTSGRLWVDDYGYPEREEDFRLLRSYSPYHNIAARSQYPAIIVSAADTDDRVVPAHSFKYAAALQAADLGTKPRIIRIETRAGHGGGKPTDKMVSEAGDTLGFLAHFTGLKVPETPPE